MGLKCISWVLVAMVPRNTDHHVCDVSTMILAKKMSLSETAKKSITSLHNLGSKTKRNSLMYLGSRNRLTSLYQGPTGVTWVDRIPGYYFVPLTMCVML